MKRTTEFVLGLIGGIFGIFCKFTILIFDGVFGIFWTFIILMFGDMGTVFETEGADSIIGLGRGAVALSILGIVGGLVVQKNAKVGGIMMTVAAIGGFICISIVYLLPGVLLLIGGLMAIFRKDKAAVSA